MPVATVYALCNWDWRADWTAVEFTEWYYVTVGAQPLYSLLKTLSTVSQCVCYIQYVLISRTLGLLKVTRAGLVCGFFFLLLYLLSKHKKVLTVKTLSFLYDGMPTHGDLRMWRLHPEYVAAEQWVINRSGWALLVLTEVFHKKKMGWGGGGVGGVGLIAYGEKSALLFWDWCDLGAV